MSYMKLHGMKKKKGQTRVQIYKKKYFTVIGACPFYSRKENILFFLKEREHEYLV